MNRFKKITENIGFRLIKDLDIEEKEVLKENFEKIRNASTDDEAHQIWNNIILTKYRNTIEKTKYRERRNKKLKAENTSLKLEITQNKSKNKSLLSTISNAKDIHRYYAKKTAEQEEHSRMLNFKINCKKSNKLRN